MSDVPSEPTAPLATPPATLLPGVLARLESLRAALNVPPTAANEQPLAPLARLCQTLTDPRWDVRAAAAHTLGASDRADAPAASAALVALLDDEHRLARAAALFALARLASVGATNEAIGAEWLARLRVTIHDPDWEAREAAIVALAAYVTAGIISAEAARPLLRVALRDTASDVRAAATQALHTLGAREASSAAATTAAPSVRVASMLASATGGGGPRSAIPTAARGTHTAIRRIPLWWTIWLRQTRIMRREVWVVMACGALAALALTAAIRLHGGGYDYAATIAFILSGASAIGVTFLAQTEHDPGLELTLATPVSLRLILGGRIALVVGYNCALAVVVSVVVGAASGQSALAVIQGWVGPLLLVSAVTLAISLVVGSATAACGALLLDTTQLLRALPTPLNGASTVANMLDATRQVAAHIWGAHPATLILVALLILAASVLAPQRALQQKEA